VTAPAGGVVVAVLVSEGMHVEPGAPVARLVDRELERDMLEVSRKVDSLAIGESAARAGAHAAEAERLSADRQSSLARLAALESRARHLTLRAVTGGVVITPRPEDLIGRRVHAGDSLMTIAANDSVEVRVALRGGGATRVRPGQVVHLVSYTDAARPWTALVTDVSVIGIRDGRRSGSVEARIHLAAGSPWLRESTGEASVELERSSVLGALLWRARELLRTDLWL
jgi:multidrug resistance efflux pump